MYRSAIVFLIAGCLGVMGCGHGHLVPSATAKVVPGTDGEAAFVVADGLRCTAESAAWAGRPGDLPSFVAPIKVRIRNDSDQPVRVRYQDFVLLGPDGRKYRPLPPVPMDHAGVTINPIYAADKFFVAPLFHDVYPDLPSWTDPLPRDQVLYDQEYAKWGDSRPGRHVLREGLPEGMLDSGGSVTGFLYFESPVSREDRATFEAELERGGAGAGHATTIKIPFRVD